MSPSEYNYLFVSDMHIASGFDPARSAYHPREDFFYDHEFFRFLIWADKNRNGRKWELVLAGDCFDFLPVETNLVDYQKFMESMEARKMIEELQKIRQAGQTQEEASKAWQKAAIPSPAEGVWDNTGDGWEKGTGWSNKKQQQNNMWMEPIMAEYMGREAAKDRDTQQEKRGFPSGVDVPRLGFFRGMESLIPRLTGKSAKKKDSFNQDDIDTWQKKHGFLPTEGVSLSRLRLIFRGHPVFFESLAWWVGRGHRLVIIPGNHDQDLAWKGVQKEFKSMLHKTYKRLKRRTESRPRDGIHKFNGKIPKVVEMDAKKFIGNMDLSHYWFYYKPGVFYAEHGHQYEFGNSINNLVTPWVETKYDKGIGKESTDKIKVLNYPIGSLIVEAIVGPLEDWYPEWENSSSLGSYVGNLLRAKPAFMVDFLLRQGGEFWKMLKGIEKMEQESGDEKKKSPFPSDDELKVYADREKLPASLGPTLYDNWARPLLSYEKLSAALLGPARYFWFGLMILVSLALFLLAAFCFIKISSWVTDLLVKIAFFTFTIIPDADKDPTKWSNPYEWWGVNALGYLVSFLGLYGTIRSFITYPTGWIKSFFSSLMTEETKKLVDRYIMPTEYIKTACEQTHAILRSNLKPKDTPYYYIMGHDHFPNFHVIEDRMPDRKGQTFYVNTGSWLPAFVNEGTRRMRTRGSDSEFTFFMLTGGNKNKRYTGELLRWNDDAGQAQPQITPPMKFDDKEEKAIKKRIEENSPSPQKWTVKEILENYRINAEAKAGFSYLDKKIQTLWGLEDEYWERPELHSAGGKGSSRKVRRETHYMAGICQWVIIYWTLDTNEQFCRIQLKPAQKSWVQTARFPESKPAQNPNVFLVTLPISDGLGEAICDMDSVTDDHKKTVEAAMQGKCGFVTLEAADKKDCKAILEVLKAIAQKKKLELQ